MNLIEMRPEELMLLSVTKFYLIRPDSIIESLKVVDNAVMYYDTNNSKWKPWTPPGMSALTHLKVILSHYESESKLYMEDKE